MFWILVAALFGIFRFRWIAYWKWVAILAVWCIGAPILFQGGGTLQDPSGDGLITRDIRFMTNDGPGVAIFGLLFVVAFYGGIAFIVTKLLKNGRDIQRQRLTEGNSDLTQVSQGRKLGEAALATALTAGWFYLSIVGLQQDSETAAAPATVPVPVITPVAPKEGPDPIAAQLAKVSAELDMTTPQTIDEITTLAGASSEGRVFIYHYKLSRRDASDEQLRAFARENAVANACKNSDMAGDMKDYGITYRYSYELPNAPEPVVIDATYEECKALGLAT